MCVCVRASWTLKQTTSALFPNLVTYEFQTSQGKKWRHCHSEHQTQLKCSERKTYAYLARFTAITRGSDETHSTINLSVTKNIKLNKAGLTQIEFLGHEKQATEKSGGSDNPDICGLDRTHKNRLKKKTKSSMALDCET